MSVELDVSSEAQVPSSEAQFKGRDRKKAGRSPSQQQSIFPKLPKAVLMWIIEVMSTV